MRQEVRTLDGFRREIDEIDDALHDLLRRRTEVSRAIARVKYPDGGTGGLAQTMRPGREAAILRRLLGRHEGALPPRVVVRIWREIISSSLRTQSKFHLHVFAGEQQTAMRDLAHGYFGSLTPIRSHMRASLVVHACAEEPNSLGILPLPEMEEPVAAWWAQLAPAGERGPRVVAKLPFLVDGDDTPPAYVIGSIEQEPSGDDTTLLLMEITAGMSRKKLQGFLKDAGFEGRLAAAGRTSEKNAPDEILVELSGFVGRNDPRLAALSVAAGDAAGRIALIGGFANPVVMPPPRDQR
jgi:chorismate mutase